MKTIKIKRNKFDIVKVTSSRSYQPKELIETMIEALAYEVCLLKKPHADSTDLFIATANAINAAISTHFDQMYPPVTKLEWEVV